MKKVLMSFLSFIILSSTILFVGCAPKGDPSQILNDYYQNIKDNNIEGAYNKLSEATKKSFSKEDFIYWQKLNSEISTYKSVKVEKSNEYKSKYLDGINFKNLIEFNVVENSQDLYQNKEVTFNYKRYVINDNGVWKIYRGRENSKEIIAETATKLAWMYIEGKGVTKNLNQAATTLNDALKYSNDNADVYYALGRTYTELNRYDEAVDATNKYLSKAKDNESKSNGYNLLGVISMNRNQMDNAKISFNKALELNPNNQYAKTNLQQIK